MDIDLKDYDLDNAPVKVELDGKSYLVDRIRQKHQIATRNWIMSERLAAFMGDTLRFNLMPAEASGIAIANIVKEAPTLTDMLNDIVQSCHLMAQALTVDGRQLSYAEVQDLEHYTALRTVWLNIGVPQKETGSDPTKSTDGQDQAT